MQGFYCYPLFTSLRIPSKRGKNPESGCNSSDLLGSVVIGSAERHYSTVLLIFKVHHSVTNGKQRKHESSNGYAYSCVTIAEVSECSGFLFRKTHNFSCWDWNVQYTNNLNLPSLHPVQLSLRPLAIDYYLHRSFVHRRLRETLFCPIRGGGLHTKQSILFQTRSDHLLKAVL